MPDHTVREQTAPDLCAAQIEARGSRWLLPPAWRDPRAPRTVTEATRTSRWLRGAQFVDREEELV